MGNEYYTAAHLGLLSDCAEMAEINARNPISGVLRLGVVLPPAVCHRNDVR